MLIVIFLQQHKMISGTLKRIAREEYFLNTLRLQKMYHECPLPTAKRRILVSKRTQQGPAPFISVTQKRTLRFNCRDMNNQSMPRKVYFL